MKKIPTLFERIYEDGKVVGISNKVHEGMEWVLDGEGVATVKFDGSCTAIIGGTFYKRFDAKEGRKIPEGAIPCSVPDPITGHWPHWVKVDPENPSDKWFIHALHSEATIALYGEKPKDGTYEAVGLHFQGNPYELDLDCLVRHGMYKEEVPRTYEGIRQYLKDNYIEGLVFWKDGEPQCKIKRSDFGFEWNRRSKNG